MLVHGPPRTNLVSNYDRCMTNWHVTWGKGDVSKQQQTLTSRKYLTQKYQSKQMHKLGLKKVKLVMDVFNICHGEMQRCLWSNVV